MKNYVCLENTIPENFKFMLGYYGQHYQQPDNKRRLIHNWVRVRLNSKNSRGNGNKAARRVNGGCLE